MRDLFRDSAPFLAPPPRPGARGGARAEARRLLDVLRTTKRATGKDRASVAELAVLCDELGLHAAPLHEMLEGLNEAGELPKQGPQLYGF
jgi:hypothetical protein